MESTTITSTKSTTYTKVYSDTITVGAGNSPLEFPDGVYQINWRAFITGKVCIRLLIDDEEIIKKAYQSDGINKKSCVGFLDKQLTSGNHVMTLEFLSQDGLSASITGSFIGIMNVQYLENNKVDQPINLEPVTRKSTTKQEIKPISTTIGKRSLDL